MRCAASAGDEAFHSLPDQPVHPLGKEIGRAMRGERPRLVRHAEIGQAAGGVLHDVPVTGAAHHDADQRFLHGAFPFFESIF
jgi:hypothetical protein